MLRYFSDFKSFEEANVTSCYFLTHGTAQVMLCSAWAHFESYFGYLYSGKETTWDIFLNYASFLVSRLQTKKFHGMIKTWLEEIEWIIN